MKVFYCGCKSIMKTQKMAFPRGEGIEVTEEIGTKVLAIDGFYKSMTKEAKEELAGNEKRAKVEAEKLKGGVKVVEVKDEKLVESVESLKKQLEEATNGSQLEALTKENEKLKADLADAVAKITAMELQAKSNTKAK